VAAAARGGVADGETLIFRRRSAEPSGPPPHAVFAMRFFSFSAPYAIKQISPVRFDASASQGDGLTYYIEFGDRQYTTDATAVHPLEKVGSYTARLTVIDRFGRTDVESRPFRVETLVANRDYFWWQGTTTLSESRPKRHAADGLDAKICF
jgi:PKD repeat protein